MTWSRRAMLAAPLLAACKPGRGAEQAQAWPELRFARHAIQVPPALLAKTETEFQIGVKLGYESSEAIRAQARWDQSKADMFLDRRSTGEMLPGVEIEEVNLEGVSVIASTYQTEGSTPSCNVSLLLRRPDASLFTNVYYPEYAFEESLSDVKEFLANLEHLPSTRRRRNPFCLPHFEIELAPDLGQRIDVQLSDTRGRVLEIETALVRGREALDMGVASFVRFNLSVASRTGTGTKANAIRSIVSRRVAGIVATQYVWTTDGGEGGRLNFAWIHRGTAFDVRRPYLSLFYTGDLARASSRQLHREWNSMLSSLHLIPQADLEFVYPAV